MTKTMLIGLVLVMSGAMALYQVRNGAFMSMLGHLIHATPTDEAELKPAFAALGDMPSASPGVRLADVAGARLSCAIRFSNARPTGAAKTAFMRMNLMLLGVGTSTFDPLIDPEAYRLAELRRELTNDATPWRWRELNRGEERALDEIFSDLMRFDHPAYADLNLREGFSLNDLSVLTSVMLRNGEDFHNCVQETRS